MTTPEAPAGHRYGVMDGRGGQWLVEACDEYPEPSPIALVDDLLRPAHPRPASSALDDDPIADRLTARQTESSVQNVRVELEHHLNAPTEAKVWRDGVLVFDGQDRTASVPAPVPLGVPVEAVEALADEWESGHLASSMRWPTITLADAVQQLRALLVPDQQTSEGSEQGVRWACDTCGRGDAEHQPGRLSAGCIYTISTRSSWLTQVAAVTAGADERLHASDGAPDDLGELRARQRHYQGCDLTWPHPGHACTAPSLSDAEADVLTCEACGCPVSKHGHIGGCGGCNDCIWHGVDCPSCGSSDAYHGVIVEVGEPQRWACDECGHVEQTSEGSERTFTAAEVIEIANQTSDPLGNLYRLDFIDRINHEAGGER